MAGKIVFEEADIRFLVGDQGQGKSVTGVAYTVDDYFKYASVILPSGTQYPIVATYPNYVFQNGDRFFQLPRGFRQLGYQIVSPIKIFANFTFYGVKYYHCDLPTMIANINSSEFTDAWFLLDESFMTDKRYTMTQAGKIVAEFGATIRKRRLHFLLLMQYKSMGELRYRAFATQTILCSRTIGSPIVTLTISRKHSKQKTTVSYDSRQYWRYFDTNELIPIPEHIIERAKIAVGASSV
jgi:hypothetical protein